MNDNRYGIYVDANVYRQFEENRARLGLSQQLYLINLMGKDYTSDQRYKHVDLNQTRLYKKEE